MAWLKIDDRIRTHPKVVAAGPAAAWFWFCGICYCREHLTDGFILDGMLPSLAPGVTNGRTLATRLVDAKLWHEVPGGYQVHDFLDWNPTRADVVAAREADKARKKRGIPTESTQHPTGIQTTPSRDRAAARGLGLGSGEPEEGMCDQFWQEWRRVFSARGQFEPLQPRAVELPKLLAICERVPDQARLASALAKFVSLTDTERKALNIKALTLGYFYMALPDLLPSAAAPCRHRHQPPCATDVICTEKYLTASQVGA